MKTVTVPIIPKTSNFAKINKPHEPNLKAICVFSAIGFFLDQDTYWKDEICLKPATINTIDDNGYLIDSKAWFKWHYSPEEKGFDRTLQEFSNLFETIIDEQVRDKQVILPLSGGVDSRTQAAALSRLNKKVSSFSYSFKNGYPEASIANKIAKTCNFSFKEFTIEDGYLWTCIDDLASINQCYSEFTHPRQMAISNEFNEMGEVFSLGHWGDVLFDSLKPNISDEDELSQYIIKKIVKKGGMELGSSLWLQWNIPGHFKEYLTQRIHDLLQSIEIDNLSAKIRAFKSLYWAPRWTSTNLSVYSKAHTITLPYYDDKMCQFICTVPEEYLANRQLQIAYIKEASPKLASIIWQEHRPFNLLNYNFNKAPYNLPYRIINKISRLLKTSFGKKYIQRNWELQFLGKQNDALLKQYIFDSTFLEFISKELISEFYNKFKTEDSVYYSHPISMLLTLSLWKTKFYH